MIEAACELEAGAGGEAGSAGSGRGAQRGPANPSVVEVVGGVAVDAALSTAAVAAQEWGAAQGVGALIAGLLTC